MKAAGANSHFLQSICCTGIISIGERGDAASTVNGLQSPGRRHVENTTTAGDLHYDWGDGVRVREEEGR